MSIETRTNDMSRTFTDPPAVAEAIATQTKYGKLIVLADLGRRDGVRRILVRCDCGKEKEARAHHVIGNHTTTRSCGCVQRMRIRHGQSRSRSGRKATPTWNTWHSMISRCYTEASRAYSDYGGRGITVDPRWMTFENFLEDMGERPPGKFSIDRIDNNLLVDSYSKANCRWATPKQQANNRRPPRRRVKAAKGTP